MVEIKRTVLNLSDLKNKNLRFSEFLHILTREDISCLFHSLSIGKIFLDNKTLSELKEAVENDCILKWSSDEKSEELLKFMYEKYMLVEEGDDVISFDHARKALYDDWGVRLLYLMVTDKCNLGCKYCFIERNFQNSFSKTEMSFDVSDSALDYFSEILDSSANNPQIIFYGGEPLLNFKTIQSATKKVNSLKDNGKLPSKVSLNLLTNATLVTEEIVNFLHNNRFEVGVSIDGPVRFHNEMRIYPEGHGSFHDVMQGITLLKEKFGNTLGFSVVPGPHNIDELPNIMEWLVTEIGAEKIGISLPTHPFYFNPKEIANQIFKSYLVLKEYGYGEDRIVRILRPLVNERIYPSDCGAIGGQIIVAPDGKVGVCHGFLGSRNFFVEDIFTLLKRKISPFELSQWQKWAVRSPLAGLCDLCKTCPALGVCGGGCGLNAYHREGDIYALDKAFCTYIKEMLQILLWHLYDEQKTKKNT